MHICRCTLQWLHSWSGNTMTTTMTATMSNCDPVIPHCILAHADDAVARKGSKMRRAWAAGNCAPESPKCLWLRRSHLVRKPLSVSANEQWVPPTSIQAAKSGRAQDQGQGAQENKLADLMEHAWTGLIVQRRHLHPADQLLPRPLLLVQLEWASWPSAPLLLLCV